MLVAELKVSMNAIKVKQLLHLTRGTVGAEVLFSFGPEWNGLSRTAIFRTDLDTRDVVNVQEGLPVEIPWEVLDKISDDLMVGVYGVNGDHTVTITTAWASLGRIYPSARPSDQPPQPPSPSWTEQLQSQVNQALEEVRKTEPLAAEAGKAARAAQNAASAADTSARDAHYARAAAEDDAGKAETAKIAAEASARQATGSAELAEAAGKNAEAAAAAVQMNTELVDEGVRTAKVCTVEAKKAADRAVQAADRAAAMIRDDVRSPESTWSSTKLSQTFSNAVGETFYGSTVRADMVSPIAHEVQIRAASKNRFDYSAEQIGGISKITQQTAHQLTVVQNTNWNYQFVLFPLDPQLAGSFVNISFRYISSGKNDSKVMIAFWREGVAVSRVNISQDIPSSAVLRTMVITGRCPAPTEATAGAILGIALYSNGGASLAEGVEYSVTYQDFQIEAADSANHVQVTPFTPFCPDLSRSRVRMFSDNIFDRAHFVYGEYYGNEGAIIHSSAYVRMDEYRKIPVGVHSLTASGHKYTNWSLVMYDSEKNYIGKQILSGGDHFGRETIQLPEGAAYVRVSLLAENVGTFQLQYGSEATELTDYWEETLTPDGEGKIRGILSRRPSFNLTTDDPGVVLDVSCYQDTKQYIDRKFRELSHAVTAGI